MDSEEIDEDFCVSKLEDFFGNSKKFQRKKLI